jgi:hypothetical protein
VCFRLNINLCIHTDCVAAPSGLSLYLLGLSVLHILQFSPILQSRSVNSSMPPLPISDRQQMLQDYKSLCTASMAIKLKKWLGFPFISACLLHPFKCLLARINDMRTNNTYNVLCCYHSIISALKYNIILFLILIPL